MILGAAWSQAQKPSLLRRAALDRPDPGWSTAGLGRAKKKGLRWSQAQFRLG